MANRFFPNEMPDFVEETEEIDQNADSLIRLLSLPFQTAREKFLGAALNLKDKIVKETWVNAGQRIKDYSLYTGSFGTAYLLFKAYRVTKNKDDLSLCTEIIKSCDAASRDSRYVTFICGRAGVCALGAVAAKHSEDQASLDRYLNLFKEIWMPKGVPNELLYGRAGFLWACAFLNEHIGRGTIPSTCTGPIVKDMIKEGRQLAGKGVCPLMYEWHGKKYMGAAHGLAGIMYVLMHMQLSREEQEYVKGTLHYMIQRRFASGNYPSSDEKEADRLVHWCHGAPGVALTFAKAAQVFGDKDFKKAAMDAGEVVWNRGLLRRVGICHGVSGNAYVFLSLYRLTGYKEYLYRAKAFACFLLDRAEFLIKEGEMDGGDHPFSLFEGSGGMNCLFLDMIAPSEARFPAYEL